MGYNCHCVERGDAAIATPVRIWQEIASPPARNDGGTWHSSIH
jgi:hypothetical protein